MRVSNLRIHQIEINKILSNYSQSIPVASPIDVLSKLNTLVELIVTEK